MNTTQTYCGYEQTTADAAAIALAASTATPTFTATPGISVSGKYSISTAPYDVAVMGPANGPATTLFVPDSFNSHIYALNLSSPATYSVGNSVTQTANPVGLAVDNSGTYLYSADPGSGMVDQFLVTGGYSSFATSWQGCIGNGAMVTTSPDTQASTGALAKPRYVGFDTSGNLFITDTGTSNVSNVMEYFNPIAILSGPSTVNYWNGSLHTTSGGVTANVGQIITIPSGSTTVVVANAYNNRIDFYSSAGVSVATSLTSANGTNFINPQGVAYSNATGYLYISDTGNNRIVEMTPSGTFVTALGPALGGSNGSLNGPTGIKLDNALQPNIYVADTLNNRIVVLH